MIQVALKSWVNGEPGDKVDLLDRGLMYGDGFFTTALIKDQEIQLESYHVKRIENSAKKLAINLDLVLLLTELKEFVGGLDRGLLKITVTRQGHKRGYYADQSACANRYLQAFEMPENQDANKNREEGVEVFLCETKLSSNASFAGLKHLNRLDQVIARSEQHPEVYPEGLMCDSDANIIEGTMSNLFFRVGGEVLTPSLEKSGVSGVMRAFLIDQLSLEGIVVKEASVSVAEIKQADEVFLSNSVIGIWPVIKFQEKEWAVGALSQKLQPWDRVL